MPTVTSVPQTASKTMWNVPAFTVPYIKHWPEFWNSASKYSTHLNGPCNFNAAFLDGISLLEMLLFCFLSPPPFCVFFKFICIFPHHLIFFFPFKISNSSLTSWFSHWSRKILLNIGLISSTPYSKAARCLHFILLGLVFKALYNLPLIYLCTFITYWYLAQKSDQHKEVKPIHWRGKAYASVDDYQQCCQVYLPAPFY